MITTDLTLINGQTSSENIDVLGVTFQIGTKLTVNSGVVFPFTIAIGSSSVISIDFDDTLYSGDFIELITINTQDGKYDLVHDVTIKDIASVPSQVIDFEAINGSGQVTFNWSDAIGNPTPTYDIFEDGISIASDVDQTYVRTVVAGVRAYRVDAVSTSGRTASNGNVGISTDAPSDILDFNATDDETGQITMTFTPSTGYPVPRHRLFEDSVEVVGADNIASGYIHILTSGTHSYRVEAYNGVGDPIPSNPDNGTAIDGTPALTPPSEIIDFAASDFDVGSITMTFTDSIGNPIPTYNLFENNIEVATGVSDGHVHDVVAGTYTYRVDAINSEGTQPSNDEDGTSAEYVGLPKLVSITGELTGVL